VCCFLVNGCDFATDPDDNEDCGCGLDLSCCCLEKVDSEDGEEHEASGETILMSGESSFIFDDGKL